MEQKKDKPLSVVKQCSQETLEVIDKFLIDLYKDLIKEEVKTTGKKALTKK